MHKQKPPNRIGGFCVFFIIIQTKIRLSSKCDFHIADRICFAGVDISEHLVCVAK